MAKRKVEAATKIETTLDRVDMEDDTRQTTINLGETKETVNAVCLEDLIPDINSKGWSDFLMNQLNEDEKTDGYPNYFGLRRLFEKWIGDIIDVDMHLYQAADFNNLNRATVQCTLRYVQHNPKMVKTISDIADSSDANTKAPFNMYTTSTAATMAESRCLRKGLRIRTIAAEEIQRDSVSDTIKEISVSASAISEIQKNTIIKLSQRLGIDHAKLIAHAGLKDTIEKLTNENGQTILRKLNLYERGADNGGEIIPNEILKS